MSGFGPPVKKKLKAEINVVPLIDVMLVLLIVFMIAAPMMTQGIKVELPQAASEPVESKDDDPITVSVKADGSYYWNLGSEVDVVSQTDNAVNKEQMGEKIAAIVARYPEAQVYVRADQHADYAAVVSGIAELQRGGVSRLGLITEAP